MCFVYGVLINLSIFETKSLITFRCLPPSQMRCLMVLEVITAFLLLAAHIPFIRVIGTLS